MPDDEVFGFLTLHAFDQDFDFQKGTRPSTTRDWLDFDAAGKHPPHQEPLSHRALPAKSSLRRRQSRFRREGRRSSPVAFRFCLRCEERRSTSRATARASRRSRRRPKLGAVLVSSALRWMHGKDSDSRARARKLLGFADNSPEFAALQSGHFNDFLFVSLVRAPSSARSKDDGDRACAATASVPPSGAAVSASTALHLSYAASGSWTVAQGSDLQRPRALRQVLSYRAGSTSAIISSTPTKPRTTRLVKIRSSRHR